MAGLISIGGLASGLDTNRIIEQLVRLERRPIDLLEQRIAAVRANQTAVSTFGSKLAALRAAAQALDGVDRVLVRKASSSAESVLGAAAGAGAARGTMTFTVGRLAQGSVAGATVGVASASAAVAAGPGTFQFRVGDGEVQSVAVDAGTTLQALAEAVGALGAGVTANAVNLGTAASPDWRLQLVSQTTGASSTITIVQDDTTLGVQTTQSGQNAQLTLAGFVGTFERETNTFSDVVPGVTLTLKSEGSATVTVEDDTDRIVEQVQRLVTAFNDLVGFVAGESKVEQDKKRQEVKVGSLATDSTVKRVVRGLHDILSRSGGGADTAYVNLSSVGIATQQDGTLELDGPKLRAALAADPAAVAQLFGGGGGASGVAGELVSFLAQATGGGGVLARHTSALGDRLRALQDQVDDAERRVAAVEEGLLRQFAALERLVSDLQSQGGFLLSALAGTLR
jgi:flagellar hook-associated protein 2